MGLSRMGTSFRMWVSCLYLLLSAEALGQKPVSNIATGQATQADRRKVAPPAKADMLRQLSASLETLVGKVSPAVVEVLVAGFGPVDDTQGNKTALVGRQSRLGSGVIVDSDG